MSIEDQMESVSMPIYNALIKTFATEIDKIEISGIVCQSNWVRTAIGMFAAAVLTNYICLEKKAGNLDTEEEEIIDNLLAAIKKTIMRTLVEVKFLEEKDDENATQH